MKNKLMLRLCLMMGLLSLNSCRQDILPEHETYNNSGAFQLTSKRISLDEAKHKSKLLPEIEQVENKFKTKTKNAQGKLVNFGNGVSIDTDDVIYIQNGPNYYTYTFRINRENASADAPVENLVLSPLSDGSWKEVLITYDLTAQEKQTMLSGGAVNLAGKVTKEILQSGTYSSGIMNKGSWDNCYMVTSSHYTMCSDGKHNHGEPAGNYEDGNCEAVELSVLVVTVDIICSNPGGGYTGSSGNESGTTPGGFNPSGGGSGNPTDPSGSNGSNNPNQPCDGNGVPSQPQDPSSTLGNQPCNNGTVTLPNLGGNPFTDNPCAKIKAKFAETNFKAKVTAIDKPEIFGLDHETGFAAKYTSPSSTASDADYTPTALSSDGHTMKFPAGAQHFGFIHSHIDFLDGNPTIKIFSPGDVGTFLTSCLIYAKMHGSISDAFAMIITSQGNYMLQYTLPDDNFPLTNAMVKEWNVWYKDEYQKLADENELTQPNVEKLFMKFITEKVNVAGLEVYKVEKGTGKAYKMNNDGTKTACP